MFQSLSDKLEGVFKTLSGDSKLTELNIAASIKNTPLSATNPTTSRHASMVVAMVMIIWRGHASTATGQKGVRSVLSIAKPDSLSPFSILEGKPGLIILCLMAQLLAL